MDFSFLKYFPKREQGRSHATGTKNTLFSSMYTAMKPFYTTPSTPCDGMNWGAVFGFGFSPDGAYVAAACENKCMLLYDPHNAKLIHRRFKTHKDCVNCVRFLDDRTFATCSDDNTVRLWDSRFLTQEIRILKGHTSWVKSIEYSSQEGKLITSGFDGNIFTWNINNYSENENAELVFHVNGIMRTKITPDENKMIISTLGGYFLLIQDLDLISLKADLQGFEPDPHSALMSSLAFKNNKHHVYNRKRNRVELITDFPKDDVAESISTMQVHPQGWCIASRNTTSDEKSEWTCIHDIQTYEHNTKDKETNQQEAESLETQQSPFPRRLLLQYPIIDNLNGTAHEADMNIEDSSNEPSDENEEDYPDQEVESSSSEESSDVPQRNLHNTTSYSRHMTNLLIDLYPHSYAYSLHYAFEPEPSHRSEAMPEEASSHILDLPSNQNFSKLKRRLLFYSEEPNVGRGFIKEQSFSCDGKVLASPFDNCVRLLGFSPSCSELCDIVPNKPLTLTEITRTAPQKSSILASTFSPVHSMFVAGAKDGSITFCSPHF